MRRFYSLPALILLVFLISTAGCTNEIQSVTGTVVDESGTAVSEVMVRACYSGWGWSDGQLVWDQDYCSDEVFTDNDGHYAIQFKGPAVMRLRARKEGWIQDQDFRTSTPQLVLTRIGDYSKRVRNKAARHKENFRQPLPDEKTTDYYCRVVLPESHPVLLQYQGENLAITPILLNFSNSTETVFALDGPWPKVKAFAAEVRLKTGGRTVNPGFSIKPDQTTCRSGISFIQANIPDQYLPMDEPVEILVPSLHAMFDMTFWEHPAKR